MTPEIETEREKIEIIIEKRLVIKTENVKDTIVMLIVIMAGNVTTIVIASDERTVGIGLDGTTIGSMRPRVQTEE